MLQTKLGGDIDDGLKTAAGHCGQEVGGHQLETLERCANQVLAETGRARQWATPVLTTTGKQQVHNKRESSDTVRHVHHLMCICPAGALMVFKVHIAPLGGK